MQSTSKLYFTGVDAKGSRASGSSANPVGSKIFSAGANSLISINVAELLNMADVATGAKLGWVFDNWKSSGSGAFATKLLIAAKGTKILDAAANPKPWVADSLTAGGYAVVGPTVSGTITLQ